MAMLLVSAGPSLGNSGDPPETRLDSGVIFTDTLTNDDGTVQGADTGDLGESDAIYDAWGPASSVDPTTEGLNASRYDKDVARCIATIGDPDAGSLDVEVANAYPGYVCTFAATFTNGTTVPVQVQPAVITADTGLTVTDISNPPIPAVLDSGATATAVLAARVEQIAPENSTLVFQVIIVVTGEDERPPCTPLTTADIPAGAVLINASGLCTYFFDGNPGDCGPGWTTANPYAWHFVANQTRNKGIGNVTAVFVAAGQLGPVRPTKVNNNNQQFYLYTPTADTLRGAFIDIAAGNLVLSHTCNDPISGGHTSP